MTVQSTTARADYQGNGVTTLFTIPFYFLDPTHVKVLRTDNSTSPPTTALLVLNSDYTVTGAGVASGGSVQATIAPGAAQVLTVLRSVPFTQLIHYVPNDPFPAATHEQALDQLTMEVQELNEQVSHAIQLPSYEPAPATLAAAVTRASTVLGFETSGKLAYYPLPASIGAGDLRTDIFVANGSGQFSFVPGTTQALTLSRGGVTLPNTRVFFDAAYQGPDQIASIVNGIVTFASPVPVGVQRVYVETGTTLSVFAPAPGVVVGTPAFGADYVTTNIPQGPILAITQFGALSTIGAIGLLGASRTSDAPNAGTEGSIGVIGICVNDASGANQQVGFGGYFEAQQKVGAGFTAAIECDTANQSGSVSAINPYSIFPPAGSPQPVVNVWAAAGGARAGVTNSSAAMVVLQNGAAFDKGIVFEVGSVASNEAITFASGHAIQWWGNAGTPTGAISSVQTTGNMGIVLTDNSISISNVPGNSAAPGALNVKSTLTAVNFLNVVAAPAGFAPVIQAGGTDTNVDLELDTQGAGVLKFGTYTAGALSPAGYITVKTSDGVVRRLLVG